MSTIGAMTYEFDVGGGTSGGGLWRVYARKRDDGGFEAVHHRLIGIASREDKGSPPRMSNSAGDDIAGPLL